jgi:glycyl-tRNA synthetase beta chain
MLERLQHYFREVRGFKYDEVNAVLKVGLATVHNVEERLQKVSAVRSTPNFEPLAAGFKRINNILKQANFEGGPINTSLLEAGAEKSLYEAYQAMSGDLESVAGLRPHVDQYFDSVMVNVPDEAIRKNRLSMLSDMLQKCSTIADFSEIVTSGEKSA